MLRVLDNRIAICDVYVKNKETKIEELKQELSKRKSLEEQYQLNSVIILEYTSFRCDSALSYAYKNIEMARKLNDKKMMQESDLRLAFILSVSGLFTQALEVLDTIQYDQLEYSLQILYCWTYIRYYENLIKYTENPRFEALYNERITEIRDTLIVILTRDSREYHKERAFKLQKEKQYEEACSIMLDIYEDELPSTHSYAMSAMGLAKLYQLMGKGDIWPKNSLL